MGVKRNLIVFMVLVVVGSAFSQYVTDPLPYAKIANPLPDTMDQLYRDSFNIEFSPIRLNQAGYRPQDKKFFYYVGSSASSFTVIDENGNEVGSGTLKSTGEETSSQLNIRASNNATLVSGGDTRYTMKSETFSGTIFEGEITDDLAPGEYRIVVGSETSHPFVVDEKLYSWVRDALLKFYGVNRCGDSQSWFHPGCHLKDEVTGGWHDCGDHLKEGATMSYTGAVLGLAAAAFTDRDDDVYSANQGITQITDGIPDMLYEAKHGADFALRSYENANGSVGKMITSMGGFGNEGCGDDHMWWGRPEFQDKMPAARGGPPRCARNEPTTDYLGKYAANLAFVSRLMEPYDAEYAKKCLEAAKAIYDFTLPKLDITNTAAYNGATTANDDAAFGALALLWATGERKYLDDLCYDKTIGTIANEMARLFDGGLFAQYNLLFSKAVANTDWGSVQTHVLWGFFRLILEDEELCDDLELSEDERLALIEKTVTNLLCNIGSIGAGTERIDLPAINLWVEPVVKYELPWFVMHTQMEWVWNRYQAGNITDLYYYYDIATRIQGMELPNTPASTDWKAEEVKDVLVRMLDYMLGVNPWDISMIYGVGEKNFNHPHHRAANPEGKNVPGAFYSYVPPVGALQGGFKPSAANIYSEHYDEYHNSETGIDGTTNILMPVVGLAKEVLLEAPEATVRTVYVGCDKAIIEIRQTRYGNAVVKYGKGEKNDKTVDADSSSVEHRIVLDGLESGTDYNFYVVVSDVYGRERDIKSINEDRQEVNFTFTTNQICPTDAKMENVKVCRVTHDSAEIFWYTPNGEFDSKVTFGEEIPPSTVHDGDISGHPTKFHYVKIGGLKEKTKYYFFVESGDSKDDNNGQFYTFTTPVEHVNFDVRAVRYVWEDMPTIGLNIMNQDIKSYDSLEMRLYVRGPDSYTLKAGTFGRTSDTAMKFEDHVMFRVDIGIKYRSDGFQDKHFKTDLDKYVQGAKPVRIEDTYDEKTDTWGYYIPVPMGDAVMESGARFRIDISLLARSPFYPYEDAWNSPSLKEITDADWSFGSHSKANGDPYDYDGVPVMSKDDVDNRNFDTPINYYITVYRKGEYVWGYSPSKAELATKKTHYELSTQITSPINNPSADYYFYEGTNKTVFVKGYAKINPPEGRINDIWVNGVKMADPVSAVTWNEQNGNYDFNIPVPVKNGRNPVDVTLFAGPDISCDECYGCAVTNHSFFLEAPFIQQYPSQLVLKDSDMESLTSDTVKIDTSEFHVIVTDRNGNVDKKDKDTLYASIVNELTGDSISVMLLETGDSTNTFQTKEIVSVVSTPSNQEENEIYMMGGDRIRIKYVDPTDPTDTSEVYLVSKANFPIAMSGYYKDENGDGKIDRLMVKYNRQLSSRPDSFVVAFPDDSKQLTLRKADNNFEIIKPDSNMVSVTLGNGFDAGVTGFKQGNKGSGKSFLTSSGDVKISLFDIADSVGPVLVNAVTLHEKNTDGWDTLTVQFSEMISVATLKGEVLVLHSREHGKKNIDVHGTLELDNTTNSFTILVTSPVEIKNGDSVSINSSEALADLFSNRTNPKNPSVPIAIKESAAKLLSGAYKDANADGVIDRVELVFSKPIRIENLKLELSWAGGSQKSIDNKLISSSGGEGTKITVNVENVFNADKNKPETNGRMRAFAGFSNFEGYESVIEVTDKAAPVIVSAVLSPSGDSKKPIDTLVVEFSESVKIESNKTFKLFSNELEESYSFKIDKFNSVNSNTIRFYVSGFVGVEFPSSKDSIWIDPKAEVADMSENIQENSGNRRGLLTVRPLPITIKMEYGPNPFTVNQSSIAKDKGLPSGIAGKKGFLLKVTPMSRVSTTENLNGSVIIYDALGNVVYENDLVKSSSKSSSIKYFLWEGQNRRGRFVGQGTYVGIVTVKNDAGLEKKERFQIGVKR